MQQPRLDIRLDQKLVMTPQLQMAIKLLQMQALDLQSFIDNELLENPFLSADDGMGEADAQVSESSSEKDSLEALEDNSLGDGGELDHDWENMYDGGYESGSSSSGPVDSDEQAWEKMATEGKSLKDHLNEQLGMSTNDVTLKFLGQYLIDACDDAGYLQADLEEIAERMSVPLEKVEEALAILQSFEPAGVGARSLAECLRLQFIQNENLTPIHECVLKNLDLLAQKNLKKLAKIAKCDVEQITKVCKELTSLTPKPGLKYGSDMANAVVPEVIVTRKNGKWSAELNAEAMPKLLLNRGSVGMAEKAKGEEKNFMNERVSRAQWLIKSLEQRARTIYKVSNSIVTMQEDFFNYGAESLKPMTLKMVAEEIEAHESTVSRVTSGKYMQTPLGVFELKYFFSSAIASTGGSVQVAAESVRQIIKRLISDEDATKPLSDEKLVELLKQEGIDVARRTVAKYRESLKIPSSSRRRVRV